MALESKIRILVIDSGGGYGGPGAFLCYLLKDLNKKKFQPFAVFYLEHVAPETEALRTLGVPVFFLSRNHRLANYLQFKLLSRRSRLTWLHLTKVAIRHLSQLVFIQIVQLCRLLKILKQARIDVIVLNNDVHFHIVGALAARMTGIPCLCRKAGGIGEGKRVKRILTSWIDLFIAVSEATRRDQFENNPLTKRIVTIHEGIDLDRFNPSAIHLEIRAELGIPAGKKVVGYISRLVEGKGHNEFIDAAASVTKRYKDVVFLIVGDDKTDKEGKLMRGLRSKASTLGLTDNLVFAGWRTDIPQILSIMDVFVHCPTTWIEGLGIAHLEAMAMGKPTVVSENGGLPDAAVDGVTGFIVPAGDIEKLSTAILRLLVAPDLAVSLGRNARQRVEELFDAKRNTRKLELLFEEYALRYQARSRNQPEVRSTHEDLLREIELSARRFSDTP
jgi:glycosyltransferase involved in cell wall biosynthesis